MNNLSAGLVVATLMGGGGGRTSGGTGSEAEDGNVAKGNANFADARNCNQKKFGV